MADTTSLAETKSVFEYRGVDNLVYAKITADTSGTSGSYTVGTPVKLAYVAEIGKTVETNSETKFYDNKPLIVLNAEGATTLTITCAPVALDVLAEITGKTYDSTNKAMVEGVRDFSRNFALGYRTRDTRGFYRYVWYLKGSFGVPDETFATENAGTETNNMTLTYTAVMTEHEFVDKIDGTNQIGSVKSIIMADDENTKIDKTKFFTNVVTPATAKIESLKTATTTGGTT